MKNRILKLLCVKSLITISLTGLVCYCVVIEGKISQDLLTLYTTIIGFYFGTQATRTE